MNNKNKPAEYKFIEKLDKLANEMQDLLLEYNDEYGNVTVLINKKDTYLYEDYQKKGDWKYE